VAAGEGEPAHTEGSRSLRDLEDEILAETGNRLEKLVGIDAAGSIVFEKVGEPGQVGLTQAELDQLAKADLITHNHPSDGGIGLADYDVAVSANVRELNAFGARYRYRLMRTGKTWPDASRAGELLARAIDQIHARLEARVDSGSLSETDASLRFWHDLWTRVAQRVLGVDYVREER
jgi:hypothetical protein